VKKSGLNATFYYIWNTFGLCLTGKTGSTEQFPTTVQNMVFSAIKNRRFDYVGHIWEDMLAKVRDPRRTLNIPYIRFFSAVLKLHMKENYPTDGTFNNFGLSLKIIDQVQPTPEDVPLSAGSSIRYNQLHLLRINPFRTNTWTGPCLLLYKVCFLSSLPNLHLLLLC